MPISIMEGEFVPAYVETVRIVNVNIEDWSVDCVSLHANKRFFDIQVASPYFHFANGEGFYCMPEVGALAWLCKTSTGRFGAPFLMGYQAPYDEESSSFRSGRMSLNPGDMMMRTRDENFLILRRGGVVQIGATPICQTMYIPIGNIIRHMCEKYEINAFGGELLWETWRRDQSTDEDQLTTFNLNVKEKAGDKGHVAKLTMGTLTGEDDPVRVRLAVFPDGSEGAEFVADLSIDNEGNVAWDSRKDWTLVAAKNIRMTTEEEDITFESGKDFAALAKSNMNLEAGGNWKGVAGGAAELVAKSGITLNCGAGVKIGGAGAIEPLVYGLKLQAALTTLLGLIAAIQQTVPPLPTTAPTVSSAAGQIAQILSATNKTT